MTTSRLPGDGRERQTDRQATDGPTSFRSIDGLDLDAHVHHPASARSRATGAGAVVLVHGIGADLDEGGMYQRLGDRLADEGFGVLRFSFRGHGRSGGTARGMTLAGEMLDIEAVVGRTRVQFAGPLSVVASSLGAVPVLETAHFTRPDRLVLWNPILDLHHTFVEPELPWGQDHFNATTWRRADADGFLSLDGEFELGRVLLTELHRYHPAEVFAATTMPALVVHGDHDSYVSFEIARAAAQIRGCAFHPVRGSDHGFDTREREDEAIDVTVSWLVQEAAARAPGASR